MSEISADMTGRAGDGTHQMSRESRARQAAKAAFRTTAKGRTGRSCCRPRRLRAFAQPARGTFSDPGTSASSSQKPNQPRALLGRPGPWVHLPTLRDIHKGALRVALGGEVAPELGKCRVADRFRVHEEEKENIVSALSLAVRRLCQPPAATAHSLGAHPMPWASGGAVWRREPRHIPVRMRHMPQPVCFCPCAKWSVGIRCGSSLPHSTLSQAEEPFCCCVRIALSFRHRSQRRDNRNVKHRSQLSGWNIRSVLSSVPKILRFHSSTFCVVPRAPFGQPPLRPQSPTPCFPLWKFAAGCGGVPFLLGAPRRGDLGSVLGLGFLRLLSRPARLAWLCSLKGTSAWGSVLTSAARRLDMSRIAKMVLPRAVAITTNPVEC